MDGGGPAPEFGDCLYDVDCPCGFLCIGERGGPTRFCSKPCLTAADCSSVFSSCHSPGNFCEIPTCDLQSPSHPLDSCYDPATHSTFKCGCPLQCVGPQNLCELSCHGTADCGEGQVCTTELPQSLAGQPVGSGECVERCGGDAGLGPGFVAPAPLPCDINSSPQCPCPLQCVVDINLNGNAGLGWKGSGSHFCEAPCLTDQDCNTDAGQACSRLTGTCTLPGACPSDAPPNSSLSPLFAGCLPDSCQCGVQCVYDSQLEAPICETCTDAGCSGPTGDCLPTLGGNGPLVPLFDRNMVLACASNSSCVCPQHCVPQFGTPAQCSANYPCQQDSDCQDPTTNCQFGTCRPTVESLNGGAFTCGSSDHPVAGTVLAANINRSATFGGPFLPVPSLQGGSLVCYAGGTATGRCNPLADNTDPGALCVAGEVCVPSRASVTTGQCYPLCGNGYLLGGCPAGSFCTDLPVLGDISGDLVCLPVDDDGGAGCVLSGPLGLTNLDLLGESSGRCVCPSVFSHDAGTCLNPCTSDDDCPDPFSFCPDGFCRQTACDAGGTATVGSACAFGATTAPTSGTCDFDGYIGLTCRSDGRVGLGGSCDPHATRSAVATRCGAGLSCDDTGDGGVCLAFCDGTAYDAGCPGGEVCSSFGRGSQLIPINSPSNLCVSLNSDGCQLGPGSETAGLFHGCDADADCGCGLACAVSSITNFWNGSNGLCLSRCQTTADCADPQAVCSSELCGFSHMPAGYCVPTGNTNFTCPPCQASSGSPLPATCSSNGIDDGTCIFPYGTNSVDPIGPSCQQAGTATDVCDPKATRDQPSLLCVPGTVCDSTGTTPRCTSSCFFQPSADRSATISGCPADQACAAPREAGSELGFRCLPARGVPPGWDAG